MSPTFSAFLPCGESFGGRFGFDGIAFLDQGINQISLATFGELGFDEIRDVFLFRFGAEGGDDFSPTRRFFIEQRDIEVTVDRHGQSARNGRCGHDEDIGQRAVANERRALDDTEFVLFIDDDQAEVGEKFGIVKQGVGADENGWSVGLGDGGLVFIRCAENEFHPQRLKPFFEGEKMLFGENLSRSHQRGIGAGIDRKEHRCHRYEGFSSTDIGRDSRMSAMISLIERFCAFVRSKGRLE
jgi:hypothetical protein